MTSRGRLTASVKADATAARRLYADCRDLRKKLYEHLCRRRSDISTQELLRHSQTILDRSILIAFALARGLLPRDTMASVCEKVSWAGFCTIFGWIHGGNEAKGLSALGGELFRPDPDIDALEVPDELCHELSRLATGDYFHDVSIEMLGHVFEQSIADLECVSSAEVRIFRHSRYPRTRALRALKQDPPRAP
jgi:hypothetical protein